MQRSSLSFACCLWVVAFALSSPLRAAEPPAGADAQSNSATQVSAATLGAGSNDQIVNQLLALLDGATITQMQAKVTLDSFNVGKGNVELRGLKLQNFDLGLKLKPEATRRLFALAERSMTDAQKPPGLFDILKFGVFQDIEIGIHFDELSLGHLKAAATDLDVQGLLLSAGIVGPDPQVINGKDSRAALLEILRRAVQRQIEVHAGVQKLSAKSINANIQNVALLGFRFGLSLRRDSRNEGIPE